jgi:ParB family chromosome partitioning protein
MISGAAARKPISSSAQAGFAEIPIDQLRANPHQPRHRFDPEALEELAASIRLHGVLQPLLVSENSPHGYLLITGERRWRAARLAGLATVPAVIREQIEDKQQLELALVENLQRRDLTPLEESRAFEHLRTSLGLSQQEIAERVGMERSTVANALRLLKLPAEVQELVENGALTAGHGRTLLAFGDEKTCCDWARRAASAGLSVRALERAAAAARAAAPGQKPSRGGRRQVPRDPNLRAAEEKLTLRLGAPVEIKARRRGGSIKISCNDQEELMRVFDLLMGGE